MLLRAVVFIAVLTAISFVPDWTSVASAGPVPFLSGRAVSGPEAISEAPAPAFAQRRDITGMFHYSMDDGWLRAELSFPAEFRKPQTTYCRVKDSGALWVVHATEDTPDGVASEAIMAISYRDPGPASQPGHVQATTYVGGDYLAISATLRLQRQTMCIIYRAHRDYRNVQVEVYPQQDQESREPVFSEQADSLRELNDDHGAEVDQYLAPVLKKVTRCNFFGPAAGDVYAAFPSLRPDPAAVQKLKQLLPLMDSPDVYVRTKASAELAKLGTPGVLAAMRFERSGLSPEQRARLNALVTAHRQRRDIELARQDMLFLTQCLEHDDLAVRVAAKQSIEAIVGRPVSFDPNGSIDTRGDDVAKLRRSLQHQVVDEEEVSKTDQK